MLAVPSAPRLPESSETSNNRARAGKTARGPPASARAPFFKRRGCASGAGPQPRFAVARLCGHKGAQTSIWPKEGTEEEEEEEAGGLGRAYPPCAHLWSTPEPYAQHSCVHFSHNPLSGLKTTKIRANSVCPHLLTLLGSACAKEARVPYSSMKRH
jgi:hypothetical protein